jgi:hypothetical protein
MSHLAVVVEDYLSKPGITATSLETAANLKRGTLDSIQREQHPRPERLGQLLRALDDPTACQWLIAYLRDDCPPEYLPRLEILIQQQQPQSSTFAETPATYSPTNPDHSPAAVQRATQRLQLAMSADASLARWYIKTVHLILGPE